MAVLALCKRREGTGLGGWFCALVLYVGVLAGSVGLVESVGLVGLGVSDGLAGFGVSDVLAGSSVSGVSVGSVVSRAKRAARRRGAGSVPRCRSMGGKPVVECRVVL